MVWSDQLWDPLDQLYSTISDIHFSKGYNFWTLGSRRIKLSTPDYSHQDTHFCSAPPQAVSRPNFDQLKRNLVWFITDMPKLERVPPMGYEIPKIYMFQYYCTSEKSLCSDYNFLRGGRYIGKALHGMLYIYLFISWFHLMTKLYFYFFQESPIHKTTGTSKKQTTKQKNNSVLWQCSALSEARTDFRKWLVWNLFCLNPSFSTCT